MTEMLTNLSTAHPLDRLTEDESVAAVVGAARAWSAAPTWGRERPDRPTTRPSRWPTTIFPSRIGELGNLVIG